MGEDLWKGMAIILFFKNFFLFFSYLYYRLYCVSLSLSHNLFISYILSTPVYFIFHSFYYFVFLCTFILKIGMQSIGF
jgi:hypothetical protein